MAKEKNQKDNTPVENGNKPVEEKKQASYRFQENTDRKQSRDKKKELENKYSVKKITPKRIAVIVFVCLIAVGIIAAGVCIGATGVLSQGNVNGGKGEKIDYGDDPSGDVVHGIKYNVTFSSDAGTGAGPAALSKAKGEKFRLPVSPYIYEGYEFQGWEFNGDLYKENADFTMPNKDVAFKAVWKKVHDTGFEFELSPNGDAYYIKSAGVFSGDETTLPSTHAGLPVIKILKNAFDGCTFKSVNFSDSILEIEDGAFKNCVNIEKIVIPENVYSIGDSVFEGCTNLGEVIATEQLIYLGRDAFKDTKWYSDQPVGQVYLEKVFYTFKGNCTEKDFVLKDGTISIASFALEKQSNIQNVSIPASVIYVPGNFVSECNSLVSFDVNAKNNKYKSLNNAIVFVDEKAIVAGCKATTIPTDASVVDKIYDDAFYGRTALSSIDIPENVTAIYDHAFDKTGLSIVNIHKNMKEIRNGAFDNLSSLTTINFNAINCNDKASLYGNTNFVGCANGVILNVGENVQAINGGVFSGSSSIVQVNFDEHCTISKLGVNAFKGCYNEALARFDIPTTVTTLCTGCFADTQMSTLGLTWLLIPNTVTTIEKGFATSSSGVKRLFVCVTKNNKPSGWATGWELFNEKLHENSDVYWDGEWGFNGGIPEPAELG